MLAIIFSFIMASTRSRTLSLTSRIRIKRDILRGGAAQEIAKHDKYARARRMRHARFHIGGLRCRDGWTFTDRRPEI